MNPEMIQLAREARGLDQKALSARLGVTQGYVSQLESGWRTPSDAVLQQLAAVLEYPADLFRQKDRVYGLPLWHRKKDRASAAALARAHADLNLSVMHLARLLRAAEFDAGRGIPDLAIDEFGSPEAVAQHVRGVWQLPAGPVRNLVREVEAAGGVVVAHDFGTPDVDGIGMRAPALPPLVFLNADKPTDRQRFTLAHELGHLVMHGYPSDDMEREAHRFAAEFLMPAADVRPALLDVDLPRLAALKPVWRVSMAALLLRAKQLGAITARRYSYLWAEMGRAGYRTREPVELELAPEPATVLPDLLGLHLDALGYVPDDLAKLLHLRPDELRRRYLAAHPTLARTTGRGTLRLLT